MIGLQAGWGFFNHTPSMPITIMLALFILPGATACSVDAVLMNAWRKFRGRGVLWRDWRGWMFAKTPRFGDVFVLLLIGVVYAAAGIAKLKAGVVWLDGSALAYYFSREAREQLWLKDGERVIAYSYLSSPSALALWIGKHQIAAAITSWATIFVEAIAPLALLWSNATRVLFGIAAIVFHVAVRTMMGIPFYDWIVVDVVIVTIALAAMIVRARQRKAPG